MVRRSWDQRNKRMVEGVARRSDLQTQGVTSRGGQQDLNRAFAHRTQVTTGQPDESPEEASNNAQRGLEDNAKKMLTGNGSTVGLPDLRAGSVVFIEGLGKRFSGRYFVTSTTHKIDNSGYTTTFECRREEIKR
jgi:phage protein D